MRQKGTRGILLLTCVAGGDAYGSGSLSAGGTTVGKKVILIDPTLRRAGLRTPAFIEIRDTLTPKGLGVFSLRDFQPNEIVEICPVVLLEIAYDSLPAGLQTLVFNWEMLGGHPGSQALALGYGGLYNGANPANMRYEAIADNPRPLIRFIAAKPISRGEELTINYSGDGGDPTSVSNTWFEKRRITML